MKTVLKYLKPYWWLVILSILLVVAQISLELQQPLLMSQIVDEGILAQNQTVISQIGGQMVINVLCAFFAAFLSVIAVSYATTLFGRRLRQALFTKIQTLSFKNIDDLKTGSLMTRLTSDVNQLQSSAQMILRMTVVSLMLIFGSLFVAISLSPQLSLIYLVAVPILLLVVFLLMRQAVPMFSQIQTTTDDLNTVLQENFTGARVVRAYDRGEFEKKRFAKPNEAMFQLFIKLYKLMAILQPAMMLILNLTMIAIVWVGGDLMASSGIQVGQIMAMINYTMMMLFSLLMASFVVFQIFQAQVSANRIAEVFDLDPDIKDLPNASCQAIQEGKIVFHDVDFKYQLDDEELVLKDLSFEIKPGETVAIMGSTGAGKTTLVNLIGRFYDVTAGQILIDDINIKNYSLECLRAGMATVTQAPTLFSGTIASNLRWGKKDATNDQLIAALKTAQGWEFVSQLDKKLDSEVKQNGTNFSGGQKQRLAIARALVRQPRILILDDATSALDLQTESKVRAGLLELRPQPTTIIVAQRVVSAMSADRIIVLNESGRIDGIGTHEQLLKKNKIYQEIYESQLQKNSFLAHHADTALKNRKGGN